MPDQLPISFAGLWMIVTTIASLAAAWGGARYALKSHEARIKSLEDKSSGFVSQDFCRREQGDCKSIRDDLHCELSRQIANVNQKLDEMERKREATKDNNALVFQEIARQMAALDAKLNLVYERVK